MTIKGVEFLSKPTTLPTASTKEKPVDQESSENWKWIAIGVGAGVFVIIFMIVIAFWS